MILNKFFLPLLWVPLLSIFLGVASNQAVLIANHGKFPVMLNERQLEKIIPPPAQPGWAAVLVTETSGYTPANLQACLSIVPEGYSVDGQFIDDVHSVMGPESHLKALADIWNLGDAIWSVGDFCIELGSFLFFYALISWVVLVLYRFYTVTNGEG